MTFADKAEDRIRKMLIAGHWPPGTRLSHRQLTRLLNEEGLGVSRQPVHVALVRIASADETLLIVPQQGTYVVT
jgi:DNA-binding GntR family transcriptional regulator